MSDDLFGTPDFEDFWAIYPRRVSKGAARKAWEKAVKIARVAEIMDGARRFANDPNLPRDDPQFIPHPATWLNGERWTDDPLPRRRSNGRTDQTMSVLQRAAQRGQS